MSKQCDIVRDILPVSYTHLDVYKRQGQGLQTDDPPQLPGGGADGFQKAIEPDIPGHRDLHYSLHSFPTRRSSDLYFVFRENELIGYNFLIGDTKKYKAFPWLCLLYTSRCV